jgi:serine/threonine-protein kinase
MLGADGKTHLAIQQLNQNGLMLMKDTVNANNPFFSPDGKWIGFLADTKLKKIAVEGGAVVTLCSAPGPRGASWGDDDNIITSFNGGTTGLVRVPSSGGVPAPITQLDKGKREIGHGWPQVLPGSQEALFTVTSSSSEETSIEVLSFKTGRRRTVLRGGFSGRYLPASKKTGYLVYVHQNTLFAAQADPSTLALTGAPQPILDDIGFSISGAVFFDFSQTGTFVYASWKGEFPSSIFSVDHIGNTRLLHTTAGGCLFPRFSPDGKRLAFVVADGQDHRDLWVKDLEQDKTLRLTYLSDVRSPVWTPDGKSIVFASSNPTPDIYWIRADRSGAAQPLTGGKVTDVPSSFSPEGKRLAIVQLHAPFDVWTAPFEGDTNHPRLGMVEPFLQAPFHGHGPRFSPDGHWLAYFSNDETGTFEVYVRPFPGPGSPTPISTGGGRWPIWLRDTPDLLFVAPDHRIMVVRYAVKADSFVAGRPQVWSDQRVVDPSGPFSFHDLAPDGKHFAAILYSDGTAEPKQHLTFLLNFLDELKRRVPVGGR